MAVVSLVRLRLDDPRRAGRRREAQAAVLARSRVVPAQKGHSLGVARPLPERAVSCSRRAREYQIVPFGVKLVRRPNWHTWSSRTAGRTARACWP